jgi:hypothetical protein
MRYKYLKCRLYTSGITCDTGAELADVRDTLTDTKTGRLRRTICKSIMQHGLPLARLLQSEVPYMQATCRE